MVKKEESAVPVPISATDLLNAGVHFGHQSKRWNPKMKRFIFEKRNGIYIIDLTKSLAQLELARKFLYDIVLGGDKVLFVGTKRQSQETVKEAATRSDQFYVISRWLGGTLTNYRNVANSIRHMKDILAMEEKGTLDSMPQKEASRLRHELARLVRNLAGIAEMKNMPGAMVVVDINREAIAVREANRVGIPVVALVDTNTDPDPIKHPIPANDDSVRSIKIIINALAEAIVQAGSDYVQARADEQKTLSAEQAGMAEDKSTASPAREIKPQREHSVANRSAEVKKTEKPGEETKAPKPAGVETKLNQ